MNRQEIGEETAEDEQARQAALVAVRRHNARLGLCLFFIYSLVYGLFVVTAALAPDVMQRQPWGGLNWALLSGFGLIGAAILLAFFYGLTSRTAGGAKR